MELNIATALSIAVIVIFIFVVVRDITRYRYLLIISCLFLFSCQKDYSTKPSPYHVGQQVKLTGINPRASYVPYNCCTCPCKITKAYIDDYEVYWFYDIRDQLDMPLTHVPNTDLKPW